MPKRWYNGSLTWRKVLSGDKTGTMKQSSSLQGKDSMTGPKGGRINRGKGGEIIRPIGATQLNERRKGYLSSGRRKAY